MTQFVVDFAKLGQPAEPDGRLEAPAYARNREPIWSAIGDFLGAATGNVLELGSGTGQHVVDYARRTPQLTWWPSDVYDSHVKSIAAWRTHSGLSNLRPPQRIDLMSGAWTWTGGDGKLTAILCINVLHISPWRVSQNLFAGAGRLLANGGRLFIYGPFKRGGVHTAPSNERFDATLRAENPQWGVRDIADLNALAKAAGLASAEIADMPSNNFTLAFAKASN